MRIEDKGGSLPPCRFFLQDATKQVRLLLMNDATNTPRTIKATITAIIDRFGSRSPVGAGFFGVDGMKVPEIAALYNLDTNLTFKALDKMQKNGLVRFEKTGRLGCVGWFRTVKGVAYSIDADFGASIANDDDRAFELSCG